MIVTQHRKKLLCVWRSCWPPRPVEGMAKDRTHLAFILHVLISLLGHLECMWEPDGKWLFLYPIWLLKIVTLSEWNLSSQWVEVKTNHSLFSIACMKQNFVIIPESSCICLNTSIWTEQVYTMCWAQPSACALCFSIHCKFLTPALFLTAAFELGASRQRVWYTALVRYVITSAFIMLLPNSSGLCLAHTSQCCLILAYSVYRPVDPLPTPSWAAYPPSILTLEEELGGMIRLDILQKTQFLACLNISEGMGYL